MYTIATLFCSSRSTANPHVYKRPPPSAERPLLQNVHAEPACIQAPPPRHRRPTASPHVYKRPPVCLGAVGTGKQNEGLVNLSAPNCLVRPHRLGPPSSGPGATQLRASPHRMDMQSVRPIYFETRRLVYSYVCIHTACIFTSNYFCIHFWSSKSP